MSEEKEREDREERAARIKRKIDEFSERLAELETTAKANSTVKKLKVGDTIIFVATLPILRRLLTRNTAEWGLFARGTFVDFCQRGDDILVSKRSVADRQYKGEQQKKRETTKKNAAEEKADKADLEDLEQQLTKIQDDPDLKEHPRKKEDPKEKKDPTPEEKIVQQYANFDTQFSTLLPPAIQGRQSSVLIGEKRTISVQRFLLIAKKHMEKQDDPTSLPPREMTFEEYCDLLASEIEQSRPPRKKQPEQQGQGQQGQGQQGQGQQGQGQEQEQGQSQGQEPQQPSGQTGDEKNTPVPKVTVATTTTTPTTSSQPKPKASGQVWEDPKSDNTWVWTAAKRLGYLGLFGAVGSGIALGGTTAAYQGDWNKTSDAFTQTLNMGNTVIPLYAVLLAGFGLAAVAIIVHAWHPPVASHDESANPQDGSGQKYSG